MNVFLAAVCGFQTHLEIKEPLRMDLVSPRSPGAETSASSAAWAIPVAEQDGTAQVSPSFNDKIMELVKVAGNEHGGPANFVRHTLNDDATRRQSGISKM